ncbi:MAG: NAD(P)-dependent oxidoreductase [Armatimonadetes bacterium]|jgi:nucleoside-diphosphate-sugar epimerase|nr:NAD(P)-dependent oxidoreductase [Armatimonadota bacterium]HOM80201.1 NAD(P)-dependent oxidoreductase [Armatimonadota bacterium]HPO71624.1 NAD(P)-dependent oxidoreductase [Armatimonadota bacterium]
MQVCVIGGTGHIGKNLVQMLLGEGYAVTVITTGRTPIPAGWESVNVIQSAYRRGDAEWAAFLRDLAPEVLVDILGADVPGIYEAVKPSCQHLVVCGSLWMFGEPRVVPTPEETQNPCGFEGYARRYEEMLATRERAQADGIAFSAVMPPNICGPGKIPLDGHGGRSIEVHRSHQRGEPVTLPEPGQTLIGPCDAWDVAQGFFLSIQNREAAAGEIFNVGSAYALTARQFIEVYAGIYGVEIPIEWVSWEEYATRVSPNPGANYHFKGHMCPDLTKIRTKLGYVPRYTPEETMERAVAWMRAEGML